MAGFVSVMLVMVMMALMIMMMNVRFAVIMGRDGFDVVRMKSHRFSTRKS